MLKSAYLVQFLKGLRGERSTPLRPLPEIVMQAIMISERDWPKADITKIESWLGTSIALTYLLPPVIYLANPSLCQNAHNEHSALRTDIDQRSPSLISTYLSPQAYI